MAENYELYIPPAKVNPLNGRFLPGHVPANKGVPMKEWMDGRKIKKVIKCLELGRTRGNEQLAASNRIPIVAIKDGILTAYKSSIDAERILRSRGIKINARNIRCVCTGEIHTFKFGKYEYKYIRRKAGGYHWFYASDIEKYKELVK